MLFDAARRGGLGEASSDRKGLSARRCFALGGLALALAVSFGGPALSRAVALPVDLTIGAMLTVGLAILGWALGRRVDALTAQSLEDPVTRVGNRRHFEERLAAEVGRALDSRMPLSLMMIDIDNLKTLNDEHGHGSGDVALALVGEVLRETCRSRDTAARFGGDEFALVLPRTRASEAKVVADRIRSEIAARRARLGAPLDALLSVSIGVADLDATTVGSEDALVEAADAALYEAKESGRDRVVVKERVPCSSGVIFLADHRNKRAKRVV